MKELEKFDGLGDAIFTEKEEVVNDYLNVREFMEN